MSLNYTSLLKASRAENRHLYLPKALIDLYSSFISLAIVTMQLFGALYLVAITAAVTSAQTLQHTVAGTTPKPGPPQKAMASGQPTEFQLMANHSMPPITRKDLESASGRIEVHWKFSPDEGNTGGLWVQFYSGANPNPGQQYPSLSICLIDVSIL
jgi:hypothetical protein